MIGIIIILGLVGGGISIYFLIQYILMYRFVNSVEFVEIASNPIAGTQKMSDMLLFRNFFIGALVLTIVFIFCFVFCMRVKEKKEEKERRKENRKEKLRKQINEKQKLKIKKEQTQYEKTLNQNIKNTLETQFCIYCGAKMEERGKYCTNCGKEQ